MDGKNKTNSDRADVQLAWLCAMQFGCTLFLAVA
jgi:hypothetical protein